MPKEKWLIDPAELDEFQRGILGLSINDSFVIKGCAGSGKTILALYRVNEIRIQALASGNEFPSFTMIVFTKALRSFIRSGIQELGINLKQVVHHKMWDGSVVDHLVVDEAQDFGKDEVDEFSAANRKSLMLYGDTQQQIYTGLKTGLLSIEQLAESLKLQVKPLEKNYRLPKAIASFASHFCSDKDLESRCMKGKSNKPSVQKFSSWKSELDFIMNEIKLRNYTDVGILLPFNQPRKSKFSQFRSVETVKEYFESKGFRHEFKIRSDDMTDTMELDFDSDLPKIITFHSSKGLQFETVFIPFCDDPVEDSWFVSKYISPFYVAVTRTYRNLYLTYSNSLTPFLSNVPDEKMIHKKI